MHRHTSSTGTDLDEPKDAGLSFINMNVLTIDKARAYGRRMMTPEHDAAKYPQPSERAVGAGGSGAMRDLTITALRVLIVVLLLGLVLVQAWILPVLAHDSAQMYPEVAYLQIPFLVLSILAVACAQVVLWCIWKLLSMVRGDSIFSDRAFRYVDVVVWAAVAGGVVLLIVLVWLGAAAGGPPGVTLALGCGILCCLALALLMLVMRGLLRKATTMHEFIELVA